MPRQLSRPVPLRAGHSANFEHFLQSSHRSGALPGKLALERVRWPKAGMLCRVPDSAVGT